MLNVDQLSKDFLIRFAKKKCLKCLKFGVPKEISVLTLNTLGTPGTLGTLGTIP